MRTGEFRGVVASGFQACLITMMPSVSARFYHKRFRRWGRRGKADGGKQGLDGSRVHELAVLGKSFDCRGASDCLKPKAHFRRRRSAFATLDSG